MENHMMQRRNVMRQDKSSKKIVVSRQVDAEKKEDDRTKHRKCWQYALKV